MPHLAPDPFDENVEQLLDDPGVRARVDDRVRRLKSGELVTHDHETVRQRLRQRGAKRPPEDEPSPLGP